jgi:hypothetical protein
MRSLAKLSVFIGLFIGAPAAAGGPAARAGRLRGTYRAVGPGGGG